MKINIGGTPYSLEESVGKAGLGDLYQLKVQAVAAGYPPLSVKTIQAMFLGVGERAQSEGFNGLDLLDDEDFLANMQAVIFLSRRKAGEKITFAEAGAVSFADIDIDLDDDEDEVADPKDEPAPAG